MGEVDFTNKVKLAVAKAADAENEDAVEVIDALLSQLEEMRERERKLERGIAVAIKALGSLPDDALGFGESSDGSFSWPLRDELIDALDALLSQTDEGERMEGDGG